MQLSKLKASNLRGLPADWPEVQIGERGLVVYGPNGTGKSSIIDGIEYVLTGNSTLYAQPRQGVNWAAGAPHVRGGRMSATLTVQDSGAAHTITGGAAPPAAVAPWCELAAKSSFILRRHMLLRFVDTQPRNRYDRLEPFLNLDDYIKIEVALGELAGAAQTELSAIEAVHRAKEQNVRAIFRLQQADLVSEDTLRSALNRRLKEVGVQEIENLDELDALKTRVSNELGGNEKHQRLTALHSLKGQAQKLTTAANYKELIDQLASTLAEFEEEIVARAGAVITEFLTQGRAIMAAREEDDCPICENHIDKEAVLARLDERIAGDQRITAAKNSVKTKRAAALTPIKSLAASMRTFVEEWPGTVATPLPEAYGQTVALLDKIVAALEGEISSGEARGFAGRLAATVASHDPIIETIDQLITDEGGGDRRQRLSDAKLMIGGLKSAWPECQTAYDRVEAVKTKRATAERLHGHAIEARKHTVQQLLDEIATIANRLYENLNPGESISKSRLLVRPTEDGSINLQTEFYGKTAPPLLHYSESHLDTLGLCYFLALRKREAAKNPKFKILVLDDVVHSVDAQHRMRFASILKEEFGDHQIIIVTHDNIFYDRLRHALGTNGYAYLVLSAWDIDRGPIRGDASTDLDRILNEDIRLTKSAAELSAAAGRLFEWLLRQLTERLEVAIRARFVGRHDIGNMWPPLAKKLRGQRYSGQLFPRCRKTLMRTAGFGMKSVPTTMNLRWQSISTRSAPSPAILRRCTLRPIARIAAASSRSTGTTIGVATAGRSATPRHLKRRNDRLGRRPW